MPGRYSGAGRYSRTELKQLYEAMESHYYHDEGLSRDEARKTAEKFLFEKTGQSLRGPFGPGVLSQDSPEREYAEDVRDTPVRETQFEREFYGSKPHDRSRGDGGGRNGESSHILTPKEIMAGTIAVIDEWLDKGASEDYARQQAEKFYIREAGKAYRAAAAGASRRPKSSRPSAFSNFSGMEDALDDDEGYGGRGSGPPRSHSMRGPRTGATRPPGWEDPRFDEYFTEEPEPSRGQSYYEDDGPRFQSRRGYSSSDGYDNDYDGESSRYAPRGYRTEEHRARGSSSPFGGRNSAYDDHEPRFSSRGGPRGYRTEERRPGGFSSSSYFSNDPEDNDGPPPGYGRSQRPMNFSGTKPAEDLYVTLGVSASASAESIKQAHRKLSIKHHPDRETGSAAAKKAATGRMAQINQAYDVLKDDEMREFYDRTGLIASKGLPP
ncbi:hypothetical protein EKO04_003761 [Ascochyta lentis]|uniref:J domain-containing protein n=1 Tax=Ascochyta lentis TaxID=205686 RepID=A0A8H7J8D9_9PLEO|nr:hypothetical protein EKO04_003761 [Ascochyta lentis]